MEEYNYTDSYKKSSDPFVKLYIYIYMAMAH